WRHTMLMTTAPRGAFEKWLIAQALDPDGLEDSRLPGLRDGYKWECEWLKMQGIVCEGLGVVEWGRAHNQFLRSVTGGGGTTLRVAVPDPEPSAEQIDEMAAKVAEYSQAETRRKATIRAEGEGLGLAADVIDRIVANMATMDEGHRQLLEAVKRPPSGADVLAAGMLHRCGVSVEAWGGALGRGLRLEQLAEQGYRQRNMPLLEIARECVRLGGKHSTLPVDISAQIRAALSTAEMTNVFTT
ncbi:unnamed protein product, partial [marine sediment metagenome]